MKRRLKRRLFLLLLAGILLCAGLPIHAEDAPVEEAPDINAEFAVIFNADDDGEILYGKNETVPVYCGFLPRVMTCLLIVESGRDLNEEVTVTEEMLVNTPQISNVALKAGDRVSWKDLIVCITVGNSMEASVTAATTLAGSLPEFVKKMNTRAKELGATETRFTNVTGKYVRNTRQITTLGDCAKIISEAMKHPEIAEPAAERTYTVSVNGKKRDVLTRNMLIEKVSTYYNANAKGLFIYSESSSNSSIATYRKDSDRKIISLAITNEGLTSLYKDAGVLLKYSQNRYVKKPLLSKGKAVAEVKIRYGKEADFVVLTTAEELTALVPKIYGEDTIVTKLQIPEELEAPVEKGAVLGTVTVFCGGKEYGTVELKAQNSVEMDYFALYSSKVAAFFSNPWLWGILGTLVALVTAYALLLFFLNKPRKKKRIPARTIGSRIRMTGSEDDEE
ncbi:MAG: D-alanyl-D-alanine carboxypeptidase [Clostridia bacterium]|nr:D-alanyl-D-alanine carboxypeptidase [Clostridia bacterium]